MHHATSRPGQGDGIGAAADAADQQEGMETWPVAMAMPTFFFPRTHRRAAHQYIKKKKRGEEPPKRKVTGLEQG